MNPVSTGRPGAAKSFSQAYDTLRASFFILLTFTLVIMVACLCLVVYSFKSADRKVYVVSQNSVIRATADYDHQVTVYEIKNHVREFCTQMFSWDKDNFNANVESALNLVNHIDGSKIFNTFKENEVFENLVSTGARVSLKVDSIAVDMEKLPYSGKVYLAQTWHTVSGEQTQGIAANFQVVSVSRSDNNPYGLSIQKVNFFQYKPAVSAKPQVNAGK